MVDSRVDFARAGVGVAVKAGAPKPDIGTTEAFKHRDARSQVDRLFDRRERRREADGAARYRRAIEEQDQARGQRSAEIVAKGEAEIGLQQINVILPMAGVDYVGPLPAELQGCVEFAVGGLAVSKQPDAAQAMVKFVSSPEAAPLIRKGGMEPPPR